MVVVFLCCLKNKVVPGFTVVHCHMVLSSVRTTDARHGVSQLHLTRLPVVSPDPWRLDILIHFEVFVIVETYFSWGERLDTVGFQVVCPAF